MLSVSRNLPFPPSARCILKDGVRGGKADGQTHHVPSVGAQDTYDQPQGPSVGAQHPDVRPQGTFGGPRYVVTRSSLVRLLGGNGKEKIVLLTFDDALRSESTRKILDVLERHRAPALFFVNGTYAEKRPELLREIVRRGYGRGNLRGSYTEKGDGRRSREGAWWVRRSLPPRETRERAPLPPPSFRRHLLVSYATFPGAYVQKASEEGRPGAFSGRSRFRRRPPRTKVRRGVQTGN